MPRTMIRRLTGLAVSITALIAVSGAAAGAAAPTTPVQAPTAVGHRITTQVNGAVQDRLRLSNAQLAALPQQTITVTFQSGSGAQTHTYTGPLLFDVLNLARPSFDPAVKNDKLRYAVTATGSDGYQALVAWAEFDPDFGAKTVLVALTEDGQPTADGRPRLVVPGDIKGGRYVSGLVRLHLAR
ncbi:molybdopterin-dependent oxidoreductase [Winogradskya humida]|uniref:Molybdopterin-binding oxidoreductase n=1 Tax=Winogradskya humida TaxID=113566 RepID=A0ABQ4A678_9ACTN|nr:molybdopterin-dependent oxidoreductase [Actinoplanes humidus]GIE26366.1 molybdopterin-binding oxidoreductase [Actinoplanes humidus]